MATIEIPRGMEWEACIPASEGEELGAWSPLSLSLLFSFLTQHLQMEIRSPGETLTPLRRRLRQTPRPRWPRPHDLQSLTRHPWDSHARVVGEAEALPPGSPRGTLGVPLPP